ncbi:MAG: hypothetical protein AB8I08_24170 [Sandaracinaceae bacterium]
MARPLLALPLFLTALAMPLAAQADTGHVAVVGGAISVEEQGQTEWRPHLRTELAFRVIGPLELGGFAQMQVLELPAVMPAFGGGLMAGLRPEEGFFGFVPSAQVEVSRVTLPTAQGRVDAWGIGVGAALAYELEFGLGFEIRGAHNWYFDLPEAGEVGMDGWTINAGVTYRLPS